jgi:hypothetical protein
MKVNILLVIESDNSFDREDNSRYRTNLIIYRQSNFPWIVFDRILNFKQNRFLASLNLSGFSKLRWIPLRILDIGTNHYPPWLTIALWSSLTLK